MWAAAKLFFSSTAGMQVGGILLLVVAAVIGGGYFAHVIEVEMLERTINEQADNLRAKDRKITSLEADKALLTAQVGQLKTANLQCAESVDKQNVAIAKLLAESATTKAAHQAAVAEAKKKEQAAQTKIAAILAAKPAANEDTCAFVLRENRSYVTQRQKGVAR